MNEETLFEECKAKLSSLCNASHLSAEFQYKAYPIRLVIRPRMDLDGQISMLENAEDDGTGYISPDASITFYIEDGELGERIKGTFDISDAFKTKLKGCFKKMHYLYLQWFFREMITRAGSIPDIDPPLLDAPKGTVLYMNQDGQGEDD